MKTRSAWLLLGAAQALMGHALASDGDQKPRTAPTGTPDHVAEPVNRMATLRKNDAGIDHGWAAAHAETIGDGAVSLSINQLAALTVSVGLTDRLQATASFNLPLLVLAPSLGIKGVVYRSESSVIAVRGAFGALGLADFDDTSEWTFNVSLGVLADTVVDTGGMVTFHTGMNVWVGFGEGLDEQQLSDFGLDLRASDVAVAVEIDVGIVARVNRFFAFQLELWFIAAMVDQQLTLMPFVPFGYGVRFYGDWFHVDLGFAMPLGVDLGAEVAALALGVPVVNMSFRF